MSFFRALLLLLSFSITGCDDLSPSSEDLTADVVPGSSGTQVSQLAIDFTLKDSLDNDVALSTAYAGSDAVVLYFTMWCPVCDSHMSYIRQSIMPSFPAVSFYFVDYVSGSVAASRQAQIANGYATNDVLVDELHSVLDTYNATMGTTIVIDSSGIVQMNEDFRDGTTLYTTLQLIP